MNGPDATWSQEPDGDLASFQRRNLLRLGTMAAGFTGATALSGLMSTGAQAAPPPKDPAASYVSQTTMTNELDKKVAKDELIVNVKDHGAKGNAVRNASGGFIAAGSNKFKGNGFAAEDVGKYCAIVGAGPGATLLETVIADVQGPTSITLGSAASTSVADGAYLFGTDDTAAIQAVLDGVNDSSYTQVFFPRGSYLTGGLQLKNNTQLIGAGRGAWAYEFYARTTRLIAKPGLAAPGLITDYSGQQVGNVRITDMMLDGARAFHSTACTGIYLSDSKIGADSLWSLERVYVGFFSGDALYFGAFRRGNRVNDCHFWQCRGSGARIDGTDNSFMQCMFAQNDSDGVLMNQGANHFYGCDIFSNGGHGVSIAPFGRMNQFTNCFFDINKKSGIYNTAKNLSLTQCRFASNSQAADGVYPDVDIVGGPPGCSLVNPSFYAVAGLTNLPHSGIRALGNAGANLVYVTGFSHDPGVTTWRTGSYVEVCVGMLHKGFAFSDGAVISTGTVNGTRFGADAANKLAFFGSLPVTRPSVGPAATDPASTQALINELRAKLISLGLIA